MTSSNSIWKSAALGAVAGLAGAWAMNQFGALLTELSEPKQQSQEQPSEKSDDATVKTAQAISQAFFQHDLTKDEKQWAGPMVHYGFGASVGALYGGLAQTHPGVVSGLGTAYGTAVWLGGDELAVPAFGLSQPIPQTSASSHLSAWASHWVYGIVTNLVWRGLLKIAS